MVVVEEGGGEVRTCDGSTEDENWDCEEWWVEVGSGWK